VATSAVAGTASTLCLMLFTSSTLTGALSRRETRWSSASVTEIVAFSPLPPPPPPAPPFSFSFSLDSLATVPTFVM